jgi:hypothetical protein
MPQRSRALHLQALLVACSAAPGCGGTTSESSGTVTGYRPVEDEVEDEDDDDADASTTASGSDADPEHQGEGESTHSDSPSSSEGSEGSSGEPDDPAAAGFDDEFDGNADLLTSPGPWQRLFPEQAGSMLEGGHAGFLSLTASAVSLDNSWYFEHHGAALVKEVTGNFAIMTSLSTGSVQDQGANPTGSFNSGGLLIRDVLADAVNENWMTFNVGRQASAYGREVKKTVASGSNYFLNAQAQQSESLLICRLGAQFRFYHWDDGTAAWELERFDNQVVTPDGIATTEVNDLYDPSRNPELAVPATGESTDLVFEFASMSNTVQVGIMLNSWGAPHDVSTEFDYIRMGSNVPRSAEDCTAELTPA